MPSLNELCALLENRGDGTSPLLQACALPRSAADSAPLPEPHGEAAFDSSWEALLSAASAANLPAD